MRTYAPTRVALVCAGAVALAIASVQVTPARSAAVGQDGSQARPVFRADAKLVPLDIRVVDKQGKPVTDLTQAEFTVMEDGVRQAIRHFSTQALTPQTPSADSRLLRRLGQTVEVASQDHRVFLLMVGRGNLTGPADGIDGLLHLVRDRLLPQDRVAVLGWNRATDFSTDHARVVQVLERLKVAQLGIDTRLKRYQTGLVFQYGDRAIPEFLQREIDAVFGGGVAQGVRTVHAAVGRQAAAIQDDLDRTMDSLSAPKSDRIGQAQVRDLGMSFDEFTEMAAATISDVNNLYASIEYLRQIEGEKHLVWLQDTGFLLKHVEDDRGIARAASDARVAMSILRAGGTTFTGAGLAESKSLPASNAMIAMGALGPSMTSRALAELTGGRYDANKFPNASASVDQIEQASRFQYVLGYYPDNTTWDARFRQVTVTVSRPGVTVLYRHGYFARQELTPYDRRAGVSFSRIVAAAEYAKEIPDVGLKATASMSASGPRREVRVDITLDLSRVQFETIGNRQTTTIELAAFCLDGRQRPVGELWHKVELSLTPERYGQLRQAGLPLTLTVPVTATAASLKLVAYDYGADLIGSANVRVVR